jgi:predicted Fe-S protein YdhL (DUF1289 family)
MNINPTPISSPCIGKCLLGPDKICIGCFRTINEITVWSQVDDETRNVFLNNIECRKKLPLKLFL